MSLQDLIQQIEKEAEAQITVLAEERDTAIYDIQKEYEKKREQKQADIEKQVADNISKVKKRADTFANMEIRNHLLTAKRALLADVFDKILSSLAGSADYGKTLVALLNHAKKEFQAGTVVATKGKEDATKAAMQEAGVNFELSAESANIQGGFILQAKGVEINFSLESILEKELWGDLEMKLSKMLFS
jgi:V/A-type H+/Na+-transporting ATPase subunit E